MTKAATIELRKEWEQRLSAFRASGQAPAAWCAAHNLNLHQMRYWLRKSASAASPSCEATRWLALEVENMEPQKFQATLLIRVGKATIEISSGFDPNLLAAAVQSLSRSC